MGEGRAKAKALLLAALLLLMMIMSCSAAAYPSNCIPRRLLVASGSYYQRPPCNDDVIDRPQPPPSGTGSYDGHDVGASSKGSRIHWGPPSPRSATGRSRREDRPSTPPGGTN